MALNDRSYFRHVGSELGMYQGLQYGYRSNVSVNPTPDLIYAHPFFTGRGGIIDQSACHVNVATGSGCLRMAFYARTSSANLSPGRLIQDCGSADIGSTGIKTFSHATVTVSANDLWWCCVVADDNPNLLGDDGTNHAEVFGSLNDLDTGFYGVTRAHSFGGAWPTVFPGSGALAGASTNATLPQIAVRYSG